MLERKRERKRGRRKRERERERESKEEGGRGGPARAERKARRKQKCMQRYAAPAWRRRMPARAKSRKDEGRPGPDQRREGAEKKRRRRRKKGKTKARNSEKRSPDKILNHMRTKTTPTGNLRKRERTQNKRPDMKRIVLNGFGSKAPHHKAKNLGKTPSKNTRPPLTTENKSSLPKIYSKQRP